MLHCAWLVCRLGTGDSLVRLKVLHLGPLALVCRATVAWEPGLGLRSRALAGRGQRVVRHTLLELEVHRVGTLDRAPARVRRGPCCRCGDSCLGAD